MLIIKQLMIFRRHLATSVSTKIINEKEFRTDIFTNITPKIISQLNRNLYKQKEHPLCFVKQRIINFFYNKFKNRRGNSLFSVHENLNPVVDLEQNFESLLVPKNHPSRTKTDCYYINEQYLLRSHMTAHQSELLKMGLNNFLVVGDVYRRDDIDSTHYPVFHQLDGARILTPEELFLERNGGAVKLAVTESEAKERTKEKQEEYTLEATKMVETELKKTLEELSKELFGESVEFKWVEAFFPFTHPSWELEVLFNNSWVEVLGCGVIEHKILQRAGCGERIGWAFGLGLERLAMLCYSIPDIRLFWSTDPGFLHQFEGKTFSDKIEFKPFSKHPACPFDISFWVGEKWNEKDFYEMIREHSDDIVEQIKLIDSYKCKKTDRVSKCYRIVYRSMDRALTKDFVEKVHKDLEKKLTKNFGVVVR